MEENKVSIITPMYNGEKFIAETIESVLHQTYQNWEMIIVDDGSKDKSCEIVSVYEKKDERIHLYKNEHNFGIAKTRNAAIEKAKGQYIAFLDSDDIWLPDKLKIQVAFMKEKEIAFCYGDCQVIDANGNICGKDRIAPPTVTYKKMLKGNAIPCLTVLIDRTFVPDISMPDIGHEDYVTWLQILKNLSYGAGVQQVVAKYRIVEGSASVNKSRAARWQWQIYRKHLKFNLIKSAWCFAFYVINALKKRM